MKTTMEELAKFEQIIKRRTSELSQSSSTELLAYIAAMLEHIGFQADNVSSDVSLLYDKVVALESRFNRPITVDGNVGIFNAGEYISVRGR